jgi:L-ascorbate metabolism protein UlaG (beta-lactamase superfamily)
VSIRVTWWGHATVMVEDRMRCLTDPLLHSRLLHIRRRSGMTPVTAPVVDAVLISHLHADHLHLPSLRRMRPGTVVLVPRGSARLLRSLPLDVVEVSAGDVVPLADGHVEVVPAMHNDRRWPWGRIRGDAIGYLVLGEGATYFAGDTVGFAGMSDLHPRIDLALLPVGGWGPWLRGQHLDPTTAAECLPQLRCRVAVPIHYGTMWPIGFDWLRPHIFHEPGREFAEAASLMAPDVDVRVFPPGASTTVAVPSRA